jgi:hypothetical protein
LSVHFGISLNSGDDYICSGLLSQEGIDFLEKSFGFFIVLLLICAYSNNDASNETTSVIINIENVSKCPAETGQALPLLVIM